MTMSTQAARGAARLVRRCAKRAQSTSTIAATAEGANTLPTHMLQTPYRPNHEKKVLSTAAPASIYGGPNNNVFYGQEYHEDQLRLLIEAFHHATAAPEVINGTEYATPSARASEVDLAQATVAARDPELCDKVLLLVRPGEARYSVFEKEWAEMGNDPGDAVMSEDYPRDAQLTGRGVGQVHNLARQTATFCNDSTGLVPELFVVSPLRRSAQTALMAFPTLGPESIRSIPWVCHGGLMESAGLKCDEVSSAEDLKRQFPGVDYGLLRENPDAFNAQRTGEGIESKIDLLGRTDDFLRWIKNRPERVIAVSSHSTWFQSFCGFSLRYQPEGRGSEMLKMGEMRVVTVKFD